MATPKKPRAAAVYKNAWLQSPQPRPDHWLWDGVVAYEAITLLSAPEKAGKTTLLSLLLDRRRQGGSLLGRPVRPGRTVVCSEEHINLWAMRQPPLDFGPRLEFHHPSWSKPTPRGWRRFIDHLLELGEDVDLVVFDPVMHFLPAAQHNPTALRRALAELRVVANAPAGVLLLHQTSAVRSRSRARGPLAAFADILIDMQVPPGDRLTRRRHFFGVGRYPGTLQHVAADLNAEGTDYMVLPNAAAETASAPALETLRQILSQSASALTRQEILARWPESSSPPHIDSLWRTLARGCELGILVRTGEGTKGDPFRYRLAEDRNPGVLVDQPDLPAESA
jgi:hypothetical protein